MPGRPLVMAAGDAHANSAAGRAESAGRASALQTRRGRAGRTVRHEPLDGGAHPRPVPHASLSGIDPTAGEAIHSWRRSDDCHEYPTPGALILVDVMETRPPPRRRRLAAARPREAKVWIANPQQNNQVRLRLPPHTVIARPPSRPGAEIIAHSPAAISGRFAVRVADCRGPLRRRAYDNRGCALKPRPTVTAAAVSRAGTLHIDVKTAL